MDYRQSGVDIDAGNETVRRIKSLARAHLYARRPVGDRIVRRPVRLNAAGLSGPGARVERGRRRHEAQGRLHDRPARHHRRGSREPLRQRHPRAGRDAPVLSRLPGDRRLSPDVAEQIVTGRRPRRAARTAARCSAARPPRCPASTPTANTTSPGSSSAPWIARS